MATETIEIEVLEDLNVADKGSFYTICGAGGDLAEWVNGYEDLLEKAGIGKPRKWFRTTGADVNLFAMKKVGGLIRDNDLFQNDLTILLFPLDGIVAGGKLALFKLQMQDRWFDDIIANMRQA